MADLLEEAYEYTTGKARDERNADHLQRHGLM
jgi:hypothetical protein